MSQSLFLAVPKYSSSIASSLMGQSSSRKRDAVASETVFGRGHLRARYFGRAKRAQSSRQLSSLRERSSSDEGHLSSPDPQQRLCTGIAAVKGDGTWPMAGIGAIRPRPAQWPPSQVASFRTFLARSINRRSGAKTMWMSTAQQHWKELF